MSNAKRIAALILAAAFSAAAAVPEHLVVGETPSRLEKTAAEELRSFYRQIFKKELLLIPECAAEGKKAIYLGDTKFAARHGIDCKKAGEEEWILKTSGDGLIITGGRPAGTLYGVYEFLERLGVVFAAPDETHIPAAPKDFPVFDERGRPAFAGRLIHDSLVHKFRATAATQAYRDAYNKWILRNRINGQQIPEMPSLYRGTMFNVPHYPYHNLFDYVPRSLYKTHPEYFQMDETGRRREPKEHRYRGGICMSNPDVRRITLESLRQKIREDRKKFPPEEWPRIYDISKLDDVAFHCRCPECKAVSAREGSGTEEGLLFDYINHIAREIRKEYPEIVIRTFGEKTVPRKTLPEKNVLVWIDDAFSQHSPFVPTFTAPNAAVRKYREGWMKISNQLAMWDYWNLGGPYFTPPRVETIFDTIQPDLKYFLKNKVRALFIEAEMDHLAPQNFMMLNYYTAAHLMVDPGRDPEKLADDFLKTYYGPAYPVMKKYFELIREGVRKQPQPGVTSCGAAHWKFLTPGFLLTMYRELHAAADELPANSRFAPRVRQELAAPVWYALANWQSYSAAFKSAGITREQLIADCRKLVREVILNCGGTSDKRLLAAFEKRFRPITIALPRPKKFKDAPDRNFKMLSYINFKDVVRFNAKVVDDPDSEMGKALKSANPLPQWHGINKLIDKKHRFYSTQFVLGNNGAPGMIRVFLKEVYQDEKYHWYRIPGTIELKSRASFWGHSWAIQASANHLFLLTTGDPKDNTWDQCWFSAKFTGPAYVPGSKKENAIFVDMMVITRGEKDNEFIPVSACAIPEGKNAAGKLPAGWKMVQYYKSSGTATVVERDGKNAIRIIGDPEKITAICGPRFTCGPRDVVRVRVRTTGKKCRVGLYRYGREKFIRGDFVTAPDSGRQNEFVFDISDLLRANENASCSLGFDLLPGEKECMIDQFEVSVAKELNKVK